MREVNIICDRCGRPASDRASVSWSSARDVPVPAPATYDAGGYDLCPECAAELRAWLKAEKETIA